MFVLSLLRVIERAVKKTATKPAIDDIPAFVSLSRAVGFSLSLKFSAFTAMPKQKISDMARPLLRPAFVGFSAYIAPTQRFPRPETFSRPFKVALDINEAVSPTACDKSQAVVV